MKDPVTPTRAGYHHGDLRQALLATALRLVAERGPEGFSLREAAREVGVSPAAAYRHFADKPALLAALAAEGHQRLAAAMEKGKERVAPELPERARAVARFGAIGQAYLDFAIKNPSFFRVMFGPACAASLECPRGGRSPYEILCETLDELARCGAIDPTRRPGAEIATWSVVHGFSTLSVDGVLPLSARQRTDAYRSIFRTLLLALGCDGALLPPPGPEVPPPPQVKRPAARADRAS